MVHYPGYGIRFQLIRFNPIGRVEGQTGLKGNHIRFQLIRFNPIGRVYMADWWGKTASFQLIRFNPIGRENFS